MRIDPVFYTLPAPDMAKALLGKLLCRRLENGRILRLRITETEAYYGEEDSACHAHHGRTRRTETLYQEGGVAYVYLCYGIHELFNIVSGKKDFPEACLIRGVEGFSGPGRLTKALSIDRSLNGADLRSSPVIWLEDDGFTPVYQAGSRIGIGYASEEDQNRPWRFLALYQGEKNQ